MTWRLTDRQRWAEQRQLEENEAEAWIEAEAERSFEARLGLRVRRPRATGGYHGVQGGRLDALLAGRICKEV